MGESRTRAVVHQSAGSGSPVSARSAPDDGSAAGGGPAAARKRRANSPAAVLEFAVRQVLQSESPLDALPAVLERLVTSFDCQAALAIQLTAGQPPAAVQAYPPAAATAALVAELGALIAVHPHAAASGGSFTARVRPAGPQTGPPLSALVALPAPLAGERRCVLALIAAGPTRDGELGAAIRTIATVLAAQQGRPGTGAGRAVSSEPAVDEGEARFRLLSRLAPVGIVLFDADGQCVFVNDRWCDWTGTSLPDALGSGWQDRLHPADVERVEAEAVEALAEGAEFSTDCRLLSPGGEPIWVNAVIMPLLDEAGQPTCYLAALNDVSARKQEEAVRERLLTREQAARHAAERARHQMASRNARLRELDDLKTQFLATVSHELRTPLTSIISFTDLILVEEENLSADATEFLGIIERNAEQLLRLVGDLLLLSRLEAGVIELDLAAVSVAELVDQVVASGSVSAAQQGVTLEGSVQAGPELRGDKLRLRQVLENLVSNAVKFTAQRSQVRITATCDGRFWQIDVADAGIGIPADEIDRLFGRFFRASNARTAGTPGTGIGLSIVKTITELHGGHVEVRSQVGTGTTFSVFLPVTR